MHNIIVIYIISLRDCRYIYILQTYICTCSYFYIHNRFYNISQLHTIVGHTYTHSQIAAFLASFLINHNCVVAMTALCAFLAIILQFVQIYSKNSSIFDARALYNFTNKQLGLYVAINMPNE